MSTSSINSLSNPYLQSILGASVQSAPSTSLPQQSDSSRFSPFAQMMISLQQLQQSDPAKYQQVTAQIATNLTSAANAAQSGGNTAAASQLNQLAKDFTNASQSGQLPNAQDLAQAIHGAGHHHHHHFHAGSTKSDPDAGANSDSDSASNPGIAGATANPASQFLAAFQSNATQTDSFNPTKIILSTLSNAGLS